MVVHLYLGVSFDRDKTKLLVLFFYLLRNGLYRLLHLTGSFEISVVLEINKPPYFAFNELGLDLFDHGMYGLVVEDQAVVLADCFLG